MVNIIRSILQFSKYLQHYLRYVTCLLENINRILTPYPCLSFSIDIYIYIYIYIYVYIYIIITKNAHAARSTNLQIVVVIHLSTTLSLPSLSLSLSLTHTHSLSLPSLSSSLSLTQTLFLSPLSLVLGPVCWAIEYADYISPYECLVYDTKQSDGEGFLLELLGMWYNH